MKRILLWAVFVTLAIFAGMAIVRAQEIKVVIRTNGPDYIPAQVKIMELAAAPPAGQQEKKP